MVVAAVWWWLAGCRLLAAGCWAGQGLHIFWERLPKFQQPLEPPKFWVASPTFSVKSPIFLIVLSPIFLVMHSQFFGRISQIFCNLTHISCSQRRYRSFGSCYQNFWIPAFQILSRVAHIFPTFLIVLLHLFFAILPKLSYSHLYLLQLLPHFLRSNYQQSCLMPTSRPLHPPASQPSPHSLNALQPVITTQSQQPSLPFFPPFDLSPSLYIPLLLCLQPFQQLHQSSIRTISCQSPFQLFQNTPTHMPCQLTTPSYSNIPYTFTVTTLSSSRTPHS